MNSDSSNLNCPSASQPFDGIPVRLRIRGLGHVPAFKNSKIIRRPWGKNGKPIIATKEEYKTWMDLTTHLIESQLRSEFQTRGIVISTGQPARSSIASLIPLDDSRQWISELHVTYVKCEKGEEGADILIERNTQLSAADIAAIYAAKHAEVMLESEANIQPQQK